MMFHCGRRLGTKPHSILGLVAVKAISPLGDEFVLCDGELMAHDAVNPHILARLIEFLSMAHVTYLL